MQIVISSGHAAKVRGASGYIDEVDEARKVVERVASVLRVLNVPTITYHDNISTSQSENLNRIVNFHNSKPRDYDISVHFNAYETTDKPMGCEVLYVSQEKLADTVVDNICKAAPFINRGPKKRTDLKFLNGTNKPAILIEVCFVDSKADVDIYKKQFTDICQAIAKAIAGEQQPQPDKGLFYAKGKCSWFGGPNDTGVAPDEGLAFITEVEQAPEIFLPYQPSGTTGLARRLDPKTHYVACRWDYDVTPKAMMLEKRALVKARGREYVVRPADWGPNENTGRVADLSPGLADALDLVTDDEVEVIFPCEEVSV